ncbi:hypothetical protein GH714_019219 [Hevea brasiliensis]|uniref:Uncharacterized protein n=1 Tax=Hevea brasiliensis TaxID=3981 RepID=A0A6A6N143_HEVBR|nr:hypothetical protein GH714_019219 [Hevea brasiliensis]
MAACAGRNLVWCIEIRLQRQRLQGNLKFLYLSDSLELTRVPDLSSVPKLELLFLDRCRSLIEIPSSIDNIGDLELLKFLCINASGMKTLPTAINQLKNLVDLARGDLGNLRLLDLRDSSELTRVPDLSSVPNLEFLSLRGCLSLIEIPSSICNLKSLTLLDISFCQNVNGLPENIGNLELLQELNIFSSRIKALPSSINQLKNLVDLNCGLCEGLTLPPLTEHEVEVRIATFLEFRNCINLDKEKVMEDVLETHLLNDEIVELCIPGDEVPQRMRYKNQRGSSLSFTLDKPNLIAVSLCLVFNPKNHYCDFVLLTCEAQFIDKSGHNSDFVFDFPHLLAVDGLESKHVCLWNKLFNMEDSFVEASFQFCLYKYSSSIQGAGPYTEGMIKCGVHPIYVRDDGGYSTTDVSHPWGKEQG